ncbi:hypothetical protein DPMN_017244 [Dreissena polymorpha]|uniref:MAM domain-containing protein n=1 Tax=Dreissena polymorpha TaxID=45954 RepID=A0A9D4S675_DREPO|nr:hypothetical protein DPMN_017244 [Dreissena polymorpha]
MMFGKDTGTLRLRMFYTGLDITYTPFITWKIIWERNGPHIDEWIKQELQLKQPEDMFLGIKIHFEFTAEIGLNYLSDIALDDIRIKQGKC